MKDFVVTENLDFTNVDKRIQHLSKESIMSMVDQYYQGFPVVELIKNYRVEASSKKLFKLFPKELSKEECIYCDKRLERKLEARSCLYKTEFHCPICNHVNNKHCGCEKCKLKLIELEETEEQRKMDMILSKYGEGNNTKILESYLSLQDTLYLATVLRCWLDEDLEFIWPRLITDQEVTLAPTKEYSIEILRYLIEKK